MRFHSSLTLIVAALALAVAAGCPQTPKQHFADGGTVFELPDAGDLPPPGDGGVDDAGFAIPVDAGPQNTTVRVDDITPPNGPLNGLDSDGTQHRVLIHGDGFTPNVRVFFDDLEADTIIPVQLPAIISVHPNCATPGIKSVRVYDELGAAICPDSISGPDGGTVVDCGVTYTCFSPVEIDSVSPDAGSTEGGEAVTITGKGFTTADLTAHPPQPGTAVFLGNRAVVNLQVAADGNSATFIAPPCEPGRQDVTAIDEFGRSTLPLAFTCTAKLRVDSVTPAVVDDTNVIVELDGAGYEGDVAATIGGQPAARDNLISDSRLRVITPSGLTGAQDVAVTRDTDSAVCAGCLVVRPPVTGTLTITAAVPNQADTAGGTVVTLVGEQFTGATAVTVGGTPATTFTVADDRTILLIAPAGAVGAAPITVTTPAGSATLNSFAWFAPVVVNSVAPASGPNVGGTTVTITGRGFVDPATVTLGGVPATDCVVESDTSITCVTAQGPAGPVDVVVDSNNQEGRLHNGFRYDAPVTVVGVHPLRGGIGGFTFVTVTGSGFSKGTPSVFFGDPALPQTQAPPTDVHVINDSTLTALTPPTGSAGVVDVHVVVGTEDAFASGAFTYFLTGNITGGTHGGPIDGAVYVTALDAFFATPVSGLVAWVGTGDHPVAMGLTDGITGTATISGPLITGAQTITVGGDCYGNVTFQDVNAAELTAFVYPLCSSPPRPGGPPPPQPPPALVRGHVFGFAKEFFDPAAIDDSGCGSLPPAKCQIALAEVTTTTPDEFSGNPPFLPDSSRQVFEEGGAFFLDGTRTGLLALVAIAGIFDINNETFEFKQMGIRHAVSPQSGVELDNQDIVLDIPLDSTIDLSLPDAPLRAVGDTRNVGLEPTVTRVIPFIQLGGEGAFVYTQAVGGIRNIELTEMPEVPGSLLTFVSGTYTTDSVNNKVTDVGQVTLTAGSTLVFNNVTTWSTDNNNDGSPDIINNAIVVDDVANNRRYASVVEGCEHPIASTGQSGTQPDTSTCGDGDGDGRTWIQVLTAPDFDAGPLPYHVGQFGSPKSEVVQDGIGDLRGGVTIQPVLGLPELVDPLEGGAIRNRTVRWKAAPGQQPTVHDMYFYDPFGTAVWEVYADGSRDKVVLPQIPSLDVIKATLPTFASQCVNDPTIDAGLCGIIFGLDATGQTPFGGPKDLVQGAVFWQHAGAFNPAIPDFNDWSLIDTGLGHARSRFEDQHAFVHGDDH